MTHSHCAFHSVDYDEVATVFPVETLPPARVVQNADAAQLVADTPADRVVAVAPVGVATGYQLSSMPFAAVSIEAVDCADTVVSSAGRPLSTYDFLVCGRLPTRQNHSLREYA